MATVRTALRSTNLGRTEYARKQQGGPKVRSLIFLFTLQTSYDN